MAHSSLRFGIGRFTTEAEIDFVVSHIVRTVHRLREMRYAALLLPAIAVSDFALETARYGKWSKRVLISILSTGRNINSYFLIIIMPSHVFSCAVN